MKVLLAAVALLAAIETEAHPGWGYSPDVQYGRGNNPGRGPPWAYPQQMQNQNNGVLGADIEWVCQNPKTNDIMLIASDDTRQHPGKGRQPWQQWHNVPPGHQKGHHQHGNYWTQPIIIVQESGNTDNDQTPIPFPITSEIPNNNNNNNDKQTQPPPYHGGEGSIDIRLGAE